MEGHDIASGAKPPGAVGTGMRWLILLMLLAACRGDETVTGYGGAGSWRLVSVDGAPFAAQATLVMEASGAISGAAPCNRFSAMQTAPYPWFELGPLRVTRRACPQLAEEALFLDGLSAMTVSEVAGDTLILSDSEGREMVFTRTAQPG